MEKSPATSLLASAWVKNFGQMTKFERNFALVTEFISVIFIIASTGAARELGRPVLSPF